MAGLNLFEVTMRTLLKEPKYLVLHLGDNGYNYIRSHFDDLQGNPDFTVIQTERPEDCELTNNQLVTARYCLDRAMAGQTCDSIADNQPADADVFFQGNLITGTEQLHVMAHLVLASLETYTQEYHLVDRFFEFEEGGNVFIVFTAALNLPEFHQLVRELWLDLTALLEGRIQGRITKFVFGVS